MKTVVAEPGTEISNAVKRFISQAEKESYNGIMEMDFNGIKLYFTQSADVCTVVNQYFGALYKKKGDKT